MVDDPHRMSLIIINKIKNTKKIDLVMFSEEIFGHEESLDRRLGHEEGHISLSRIYCELQYNNKNLLVANRVT